jgi:ElaB/YqjD/DUF883 family membrane-anchored ribosome-binding protein
MSNDPDEIRAQIEQTRSNLSTDVNSLADTVNPAHAAKRQVSKIKGTVFGAKDKVMGAASTASSSVADTGATMSDAVTGVPQRVTDQASGNPLAAGLIAFGVGAVIGSLLPASSAERTAAAKVKDTVTPMVSDAAKDVADHLKEPAQQAVESVKSSATDAAATVKDESASAASDVKDQAQDAKETIQSSATT